MLTSLLGLSMAEAVFASVAVFLAAIVRGFSGFALSALIMASVVAIIPPVELIPLCYLCEGAASIMMLRRGFAEADRPVAIRLALGALLGLPIGLYLTLSVSERLSEMLALGTILLLAMLQWSNRRPAWLGTPTAALVSGAISGLVTGIASVGGMVVALYILSSGMSAARMRATLVLYLGIGMLTSGVFLVGSGMLDAQALVRGLVLFPVVGAGVWIGSLLFRPALESAYKRFCLILLMSLAAVGLLRFAMVS